MSILIGQIKVWQGSALPNAAGEHRGKLFQLWGASGAEDGLYACFKKTDDTYAWIKIEDSSGSSVFETVTATDFKTSPTTANLDISGTTVAAGGSDANVDVNINAKGTGVVYVNQKWGVNASGTLVPAADNTYDIGNGASNPRDIEASRKVAAPAFVLKSGGIITESGTTRTLSADDNGKVIYCTSSSAVTINCAASLGAGFSVTIIQGGTGKVTVAANGQTLVSYSSLYSTMGQYAVISAMAPVANTFLLAGNLGV